MTVNQQKIQQRYEGFLQTPNLWEGSTVFGLEQFFVNEKSIKLSNFIDENLRLGIYVEALFFNLLQHLKHIELIAKNVQIQKDKVTLGELDCLLKVGKKLIHLEIVYKFYLYDASVGNSEIEHFIGPNRKDSLVEKLTKLKQKQLPLLYTNECEKYLQTLNLETKKIKQQLYFKAQLFVPYQKKEIQLQLLNQYAIVGYYIKLEDLIFFKDCKFFVPTKKDWLLIPHQFVKWVVFDEFISLTNNNIKDQYSFLCWVKKPNGIIDKIFIVWW